MSHAPIDALRHPLAVDAGLGEISRERRYEDHVVQLIKQVLFTAPGERINRPDFGCGLRQMVFAPNSDVTAGLIKVTVSEALDRWLSEVLQVQGVEVTARQERLELRIAYLLLSDQEQRWLNLEVAL